MHLGSKGPFWIHLGVRALADGPRSQKSPTLCPANLNGQGGSLGFYCSADGIQPRTTVDFVPPLSRIDHPPILDMCLGRLVDMLEYDRIGWLRMSHGWCPSWGLACECLYSLTSKRANFWLLQQTLYCFSLSLLNRLCMLANMQ